MLESISATNEQVATMTGTFEAISVGGNPPVTATTLQALTTVSNIKELYTLGPIKYSFEGGAVRELCVQNLNFTTNNEYRAVFCSGLPFVEHLSVQSSKPSFTVDVEDEEEVVQHLDSGSSIDTVEIYFRKMDPGKARVPDATAEHLKITSTVGKVRPLKSRQLKFDLGQFVFQIDQAIT